MSRNHTREVSSSRFSLQKVRAISQNVMIDMGCQRCQHCMLLRLWLPLEVPTSTGNVDQGVSGIGAGEIRSHRCKA